MVLNKESIYFYRIYLQSNIVSELKLVKPCFFCLFLFVSFSESRLTD